MVSESSISAKAGSSRWRRNCSKTSNRAEVAVGSSPCICRPEQHVERPAAEPEVVDGAAFDGPADLLQLKEVGRGRTNLSQPRLDVRVADERRNRPRHALAIPRLSQLLRREAGGDVGTAGAVAAGRFGAQPLAAAIVTIRTDTLRTRMTGDIVMGSGNWLRSFPANITLPEGMDKLHNTLAQSCLTATAFSYQPYCLSMVNCQSHPVYCLDIRYFFGRRKPFDIGKYFVRLSTSMTTSFAMAFVLFAQPSRRKNVLYQSP